MPHDHHCRRHKSSSAPRLTDTREALKILGRDPKFARDIFSSASAKNIDPVFWACLIETESEFKLTARSSKGYKGLTQTPKAVGRTGFELGDMTYGICILDEKLKVARGDLNLAMALYKGGNNPAAKKEAKKVFVLYEKVNTQIKEKQNG